MRKFALSVMALVMAVVFTGCGDSKTTETKASTSTPSETVKTTSTTTTTTK